MELEVSEEVLEKTDKCWHAYKCLAGTRNGMCPARDRIGSILFVEKADPSYCPYHVTFGYSDVCTCPVRREIHARYGK